MVDYPPRTQNPWDDRNLPSQGNPWDGRTPPSSRPYGGIGIWCKKSQDVKTSSEPQRLTNACRPRLVRESLGLTL